MNEHELHNALDKALRAARAKGIGAGAAGTSASTVGAAAASSSAASAMGAGSAAWLPRLQKGRYQRWHAEPHPVPEEEGWLMTYLDVMTLLLVMLVVMLAFSEPIARKPPLGQPQAQGQTAPSAGQPLPAGGGSIVAPLDLPAAAPGPSTQASALPQSQTSESQSQARSSTTPPVAPAPLPLNELGPDIEVLVRDDGVSFRIPSELLFASGEAALTPAGQAIIDRLLPTFNRAPDYTIVVEGHTDNVPIQTARFPSNWELAAARASSVVRQLERRGLNPTRLRAASYADTRPVASNDTPEGRARNRRVEITLEPPQRPRN